MRFIDIGVNLTDPVFRGIYRERRVHDDDFEQVLKRATVAGVEKMIITGGSASESREAFEIAQAHDGLFSTVGCHPTRCHQFEEHPMGPNGYYQLLLDQAEKAKGKVVAIGECGLDYDRLKFCPKEVQLRYFERQFDLAEATGLPMFLHNRNTGDDFVDLIQKHRHRFRTGVVHSFTGKLSEIERFVTLGMYIGINGCSLKTAENLEVLKKIPEDRLMIETDAPWCDVRPTHASFTHLSQLPPTEKILYSPPRKTKEKFEMGCMVKSRNEPCTVGEVLHIMASVRGVDPEVLAETVWQNTEKVFFANA